MDIKKVVIVGGGTAGWLAANHLGKALLNTEGVSVTLIESPDIPTIGVGEGTVPAIRKSLQSFGISETEFITQCDVTFKQSIKFSNWLNKDNHGSDNSFHHLFNIPSPLGGDLTPFWLNNRDYDYSNLVSPQFVACEALKAPKKITTPEYAGALGYAYHLNAAKFAKLLAKNGRDRFCVEHIIANVSEVKLNVSGAVGSLVTDTHGELVYDFYIDCTGFEALIIEKALKVPFVDKSAQLLVDRAIAVQVPTNINAPIPPFTIATAHQAGWIWDIALTNRRGVGFVYSTKYMDDETAISKLDKYLGGVLSDLSYRVLPMKVGYREKFWHQNCVCLGLAQGFLEPLEATSILLTDFAASYIANRFPKSVEQIQSIQPQFNQVMEYAWERVVEFIKLHYCLSDRTDSQFWIDNRDPSTIPDELKRRLSLWESYVPNREDFFSKFEVFDLDNYLYVLYGMKYHTQVKNLTNEQLHLANQQSLQIAKMGKQLAEELPDHRELLNKIKEHGLQSI
ncbi:tryptophan halogenase [Shewanella hanedai]|uniref:Tryptophan 7-halogenase n=1 Tax=Shewanella hanedai TaxID=25 RepID=A0A553JIL9_SHEHA|nr:tryptophan halogenase family protein [Shewanella hanedai]TRY12290.1 tryptophan 7-halogenase [Shewanella hanedai]GGI99172.1 tryptophan halogenase [Shewanella hanedai]